MKWRCPHCKCKLNEDNVMQSICPSCRKLFRKPLTPSDSIKEIESEISSHKKVEPEWMELLKELSKTEQISLFFRLYNKFITNKELDDGEINVLETLKNSLCLTSEEVNYFEGILPYIYVNAIRNGKKLPVMNIKMQDGRHILLKRGEEAYCAGYAALKEVRSISLGYSGGSRGVSIKIMRGVYYRSGSHKGKVQKEDRLVETSRGLLLLTNNRLFLSPDPGNKPLSIPLNKILSYNCFDNGIEIYKDGRQKGYFLSLKKSWSVEIFGICLSHLLSL